VVDDADVAIVFENYPVDEVEQEINVYRIIYAKKDIFKRLGD